MDDDRISQLPLHILHHHILSLLPQEDAVRTCLLSKSWRYIGPTRPKIEFCESFFRRRGSEENFVSVVENTLQRYVDQNLSIQEFVLEMSGSDSPLLNKWIPIVLLKMGVKTFNLTAFNFPLPSVVLQAESLEELYLKDCKLDQINNNCINVKLQVLKHPSLHYVCIEEEFFEKIMSSCPLIEHLVLGSCWGLSIIKVNKAPNLKHFDCCDFRGNDSIEIDDAPSLETIRIEGDDDNWYHHNNYFFPRLKSLYLRNVNLTTESLNNLSSNNCPCLEGLELSYCFGFTEFKLSNRSIKRLIINIKGRPIKATIDAANMLYFEFRSNHIPSIISFATTSRECKSSIHVGRYSAPSALYEFLKALSQSQISLDISYIPNLTSQDTFGGDSCGEPVVVEHLHLSPKYPSFAFPALLKSMFRICRPRYIRLLFSTNSLNSYDRRLAQSFWTILVKKGSVTRQCEFWEQDLEESSIQVLDENTKEWRSVQVCALPYNKNIRCMLKWKEYS